MLCNSCNTDNRPGSKFCKNCGSKLSLPRKQVTITLPSLSSLSGIFQDLGSKITSVFKPLLKGRKNLAAPLAIVVGLLLIGTAYAAPKINDFIKVSSALSEARELSQNGDYKGALASLSLIESRWMTEGKQKEVAALKASEERYLQYQASFEKALELEKSGQLGEARKELQSVDLDYPQYNLVREKLDDVQAGIEGGLKETARQKEVEAAAAQRRTQEESAARVRAEAERASSEAQARAAAQAAREAEQDRAEQIMLSFVNELIAGYNSYGQGKTYYNSAIGHSNNGDSILAISAAASARAVLNSAWSTVSDLEDRFEGLPSEYYQAAINMKNAINSLMKALDLLVKSEGTSLDLSDDINSYKDSAGTYEARVKRFIDSK